jgi:hypothetical protein
VYNVKQQANKRHKTILDTTIEQIFTLQNDNNEITLAEIRSNLPDPKHSLTSILQQLINQQWNNQHCNSPP